MRLRSIDGAARVIAASAGIVIVPASLVASPSQPSGFQVVELSDDWAVRDLLSAANPAKSCDRRLRDWKPHYLDAK